MFNKVKQLMKNHGDHVNKAVDTAQDKFVRDNQNLNRKIDGAQQKLNDYSKKE